MVYLVVTPLSSDFKKNGAGFGEEGFWVGFYLPPTTPYASEPMLIMYTLN